VIVAGVTAFSDLRRVQLTRGGQNTVYDVDAITKKGQTNLDVKLQSGDQIFVREKPIVF
jgi:protein involved in polysaccharide export with SLBB domain